MKKMMGYAVFVMLGVMGISCASRSALNAFGPYSAAETYYNKGNYAKAIAKYQEYLKANPQGNLAVISEYYIGKSYLASGDKAKAQESFQKVADQFPGTSWAEFSKEQLEKLKGDAKS